MAANPLNDNLRVESAKHLDEKYGGSTGVYPDLATALSSVRSFERVEALTVAVRDGVRVKEYWAVGGVGDVNFVPKIDVSGVNYWKLSQGVDVVYPAGSVGVNYAVGENLPARFSVRADAYVKDELYLGEGLDNWLKGELDGLDITVNNSQHSRFLDSGDLSITGGSLIASDLAGGESPLAVSVTGKLINMTLGEGLLFSGGQLSLDASILNQLEPQGAWNASTNTPAIPAASSSNNGHFYIVSGTVAAGHGYPNVPNEELKGGDWLLSNGVAWEKVKNSAATNWIQSGNDVYFNGGNVSIGVTSSLGNRFRVSGNSSLEGNLNLTGSITSPVNDQTAEYQLGNIVLGTGVDNSWAFVRNRVRPDSFSDYGLILSTSGQTVLNASSGQMVGLRVANGGDVLRIQGNQLTSFQDHYFDSNVYVSDYIYHDNDTATNIEFVPGYINFSAGGNLKMFMDVDRVVVKAGNFDRLTVELGELVAGQKFRPSIGGTYELGTTTHRWGAVNATSLNLTGSIAASGYNDSNWNIAYNRSISGTGISFNVSTGDLSIQQQDGGTVSENLDGRYALSSAIPTNYVPVTGGTFTGEVIISTGASNALTIKDTVTGIAANPAFSLRDSGNNLFGEIGFLSTGNNVLTIRNAQNEAVNIMATDLLLNGVSVSTGSDDLQTVTSQGATTSIRVSLNGGLDIPDNYSFRIGSGFDDLIYHSGTHTYWQHQGVGDLYIWNENNSGAVILRADTSGGSAHSVVVAQGGANTFAELRYNGSTRLSTISGGVDVNGLVQVASGSKVQWGNSNQYIEGSSVSNNIKIGTSGANRFLIESNGHIFFNPSAANDTGAYFSSSNNNTLNVAIGQDVEGSDFWINYRGYNNGFTRSRDFIIGNGKGQQIADFNGASLQLTLQGALSVFNSGFHTQSAGAYYVRAQSGRSLFLGANGVDSYVGIDTSGNLTLNGGFAYFRQGASSGNTYTNTPSVWLDNSGTSPSYYALGITTATGNIFSVSNAGNVSAYGNVTITNGGSFYVIGNKANNTDYHTIIYGRSTPSGTVNWLQNNANHWIFSSGSTPSTLSSVGTVGFSLGGGGAIIRIDDETLTKADIQSFKTSITASGTSNDFIKGDGSYDNNNYLHSAGFSTGTGNLSFTTATGGSSNVNFDGRYLPLSGGTLTGSLTVNGEINSILVGNSTSDVNIAWQSDGVGQSSGIRMFRYAASASNIPSASNNANWMMNVFSHPGSGANFPYGSQIAGSSNGLIYYRHVSLGSFGSWYYLLHSGMLSGEPSANTIPLRDQNGHIHSTWINFENNTGMYTESEAYWYHSGSRWNVRNDSSATTYTWISFQTGASGSVDSGGVYANDQLEVGFVRPGASAWRLKLITQGVEFRAMSGTYTSVNLKTGDDVSRGQVYANTGNQIGFVDSDGNWAFRHTTDSATEFLSNNVVVGTLASSGDLQVGRISTGITFTEIYAMDQHVRATDNVQFNQHRAPTASDRAKFMMWGSDTSYAIGMGNVYSFGGLNDYAMTFQMNNDSDRGFWWGDTSHTNAQGAMSLTTNGKLNIASALRVGYGESDTGTPDGVQFNALSGTGTRMVVASAGGQLSTQAIPSGGSANNATITLSAGTSLSGGGSFTTDQASNATITFNLDNANILATTSLNIGSTSQSADGFHINHGTSFSTINNFPSSLYFNAGDSSGATHTKEFRFTVDDDTGLLIGGSQRRVSAYFQDTLKFYTTSTGATVSGTLNETSDSRLKSIISDRVLGLEFLRAVKVRHYYKTDPYSATRVEEYGMFAQDIRRLLPFSVEVGDKGFLTVTNKNIVMVNSRSIQQLDQMFREMSSKQSSMEFNLNRKIDSLEEKLRSEIEQLKQRVNDLEQAA